MNLHVGHFSRKIEQLFAQANQSHVQGHFDRARTGYLEVIAAQPRHFEALHLLGVLCCQLKDFSAAVPYISSAIKINPNPVFYYSLGVAHQELGQLEEAEQGYLQALKKRPKYVEALYNMGNLKRSQKNNRAAVDYFDQALLLKADYADAYYNRGNALKDIGDYGLAVQSFDSAIALNHSYAQAYLNKGLALKEMGQFEDALSCYANAIRVNPAYCDAYSNMGILQTDLHRWPQAMRSFQDALQFNPDHAQTLWNKSLLLLTHGDFKAGFALYDARWREEVLISPIFKTHKPWAFKTRNANPSVTAGAVCERLFIWSEQGIGDMVMFGALLNQASNLANHLLLQIDSRLIPVFKRSFPEIEFIPKGDEVCDDKFDEHMPIGQLAQLYCQSVDAFKLIRTGYLRSDPSRKAQVRAKLPLNGKPTVGISWRSMNDKKGLARSISATDLVGALCFNGQDGFDLNRFNFVNLQYASTQAELADIHHKTGVEILNCADIDNYEDIDGLVSLIDACDLIVSIDNSTVHLSGALGKPTFVLLPFSADWRWGLNASNSLWYSSLRLYRQPEAGAWAQPLFTLLADLLNHRF
jgi:tetratricopeptide (TPR) repeat protein